MVKHDIRSYTHIQFDPDNLSMTSVFPWADMPSEKEACEKLEGMRIEKAAFRNGNLYLVLRKMTALEAGVTMVKVKSMDDISDILLQAIRIKNNRIETVEQFLDKYNDWSVDEEYSQE